jgi:hypothetical protein
MFQISTSHDERGLLTVRARSAHVEGRVVLLGDGLFVLDGDFGGRKIPVATLDLLLDALQETRRHITTPEIPDGATLVARCVTDESVWATDEDLADPELAEDLAGAPGRPSADIVVAVDGGDDSPIATYTVNTNPLDPIGEDPRDVLERHGWRIVADRGLDEWSFRDLMVERAEQTTGNRHTTSGPAVAQSGHDRAKHI